MTLDRIEQVDQNQYRAVIETPSGVRSFLFEVDAKDGIDVVTWGDDFGAYRDEHQAHAQALLHAVGAFHEATRA